jgi:hypothetical protein
VNGAAPGQRSLVEELPRDIRSRCPVLAKPLVRQGGHFRRAERISIETNALLVTKLPSRGVFVPGGFREAERKMDV